MFKKALIILVTIITTGYVFDWGTKAMNTASDVGYIGGLIGMFLWVGLAWIVWKKFIFKQEKKKNEESNSVAGVAPSVDTDSGLHNPNRAGNGGN